MNLIGFIALACADAMCVDGTSLKQLEDRKTFGECFHSFKNTRKVVFQSITRRAIFKRLLLLHFTHLLFLCV